MAESAGRTMGSSITPTTLALQAQTERSQQAKLQADIARQQMATALAQQQMQSNDAKEGREADLHQAKMAEQSANRRAQEEQLGWDKERIHKEKLAGDKRKQQKQDTILIQQLNKARNGAGRVGANRISNLNTQGMNLLANSPLPLGGSDAQLRQYADEMGEFVIGMTKKVGKATAELTLAQSNTGNDFTAMKTNNLRGMIFAQRGLDDLTNRRNSTGKYTSDLLENYMGDIEAISNILTSADKEQMSWVGRFGQVIEDVGGGLFAISNDIVMSFAQRPQDLQGYDRIFGANGIATGLDVSGARVAEGVVALSNEYRSNYHSDVEKILRRDPNISEEQIAQVLGNLNSPSWEETTLDFENSSREKYIKATAAMLKESIGAYVSPTEQGVVEFINKASGRATWNPLFDPETLDVMAGDWQRDQGRGIRAWSINPIHGATVEAKGNSGEVSVSRMVSRLGNDLDSSSVHGIENAGDKFLGLYSAIENFLQGGSGDPKALMSKINGIIGDDPTAIVIFDAIFDNWDKQYRMGGDDTEGSGGSAAAGKLFVQRLIDEKVIKEGDPLIPQLQKAREDALDVMGRISTTWNSVTGLSGSKGKQDYGISTGFRDGMIDAMNNLPQKSIGVVPGYEGTPAENVMAPNIPSRGEGERDWDDELWDQLGQDVFHGTMNEETAQRIWKSLVQRNDDLYLENLRESISKQEEAFGGVTDVLEEINVGGFNIDKAHRGRVGDAETARNTEIERLLTEYGNAP